jgi:uncharacterized YigZ family protein
LEPVNKAYKTVYEGGVGEVEFKKSRFIATVAPVETEEAAIEFIDGLKKKYWDATHNCSAYVIGLNPPIMRCSDDGEPSKTAGWPMLDVLIGQELTNVVVVVTRYFGGTLLGTGGLVKAYQTATIEGLNNSTIIKKEPGVHLLITTDYNSIGKIQYHIKQSNIATLSTDYTDIVQINVMVPIEQSQRFIKDISEITGGSAQVEELKQVYFATIKGEVHLF